jgi:hypothetical protein
LAFGLCQHLKLGSDESPQLRDGSVLRLIVNAST